MILIKKPEKLPTTLKNNAETETNILCEEYLNNKADYENGEKKFKFKNSIYGSKSVKNALIKAQNGKCFLCESRIRHISHGDVEHFRPKGGSCQDKESEMRVPGYYWLAYDWDNLFLACQMCNQRFKRNLFPLENEDERAVSHKIDFSIERPLFINPEKKNPEDFISFRGVIPYAIDGNAKGKVTIENAGLKREELKENRRELYDKVKTLYKMAQGVPETPYREEALEALNKELEKCQSPQHQYTAMFRAAIRDNFKY